MSYTQNQKDNATNILLTSVGRRSYLDVNNMLVALSF